jgi:hypothetical protein
MKNSIIKAFIYTIILLFASCNGQDSIEKYKFKILGSETMGMAKKSVYIQIPEQLTEPQLKEIATQLREENNGYDRLFIFYLLPDMTIGSGAWATTHYQPELEINIMGIGEKEKEKLKKVELPEGEIIGKWYDDRPYVENSMIIYKVNNTYKLKQAFKDGSGSDRDLKQSMLNGKLKFVYKNDFGEYLLIEKDGRLGVYDKDGLVNTVDIIE